MATKRIDCVDISHHNDEPDFVAAKKAGLIGVIMKATEGTTYIDNTFGKRREAAKAAGLECFSYHFLKHGNVSAQIAHYLDVVSPAKGERVVIDYEDKACTLSDLRSAVQALFDQPLNLQVTVYGGSLLEEHLGSSNDALLAKTSLWTAQYTTAAAPSWPTGTWPVWSLWQFSDAGHVTGFPGNTDANTFNGSVENARKWMAPAGAEPEPGPTPEPEAPEVVVDIIASAGVVVVVRVNDKVITR